MLFVLLFFEKKLGLNVLLFSASVIMLLFIFKRDFFKPILNKTVAIGFLLISAFYSFYGSPFTLFVSLLSFNLIIGLHTLPALRSIAYVVPNGVLNFFKSFADFFASFSLRSRNTSSLSKIFRIVLLPLIIITIFIVLYANGSSFFSEIVGSFMESLSNALEILANYLDIKVIGVIMLGFLFSLVHSLKRSQTTISLTDQSKSDGLLRDKTNKATRFKNLDLKYEYKSGVFLFTVLNLLLLIVVFLEIKNIWFPFEWQGEMLKEMVHKGTYTLIFTILVSIAVTLYFFKKNLNFYKNNRHLKILANVWIVLNGLLVVSVFIRNAYYIKYFALAYKRIGVILFLMLCLIGLVTLFIKIRKKKSTYYMFRTNSLAAYLSLVAVCFVNWDVVIAKYNFNHYKSAFVHLPFMSRLSDKALPFLQLSDQQIKEIEDKQVENIPFASRGYFKNVRYKKKIDRRVKRFVSEQEKAHWLEFVVAERRAFAKLKSQQTNN